MAHHLLATVGQVMIEARRRDERADGREWEKRPSSLLGSFMFS
jgi:hypothetical protein